MPQSSIPNTVVKRDHELEGQATRSAEELAKHRWHNTLDPKGPQYTIRSYGSAIGRSERVVRAHAKGYELYLERLRGPATQHLSLEDAFRLSVQSSENQAFSEAIAEGSGESVGRVARGDNAHRRGAVIEQARQRAERRGTDPVDEARDIATRQRQTREMEAREQERARSRRSIRYVHIEGHLAAAQRRLLGALSEAEGVGFDDDELELIRDSIEKVRAVLNLIDLRMAGAPDIDWDGELARLGGAS